MLNRTILVGQFNWRPRIRTTQSGVNVASFTLAVNRTFTNAQRRAQRQTLLISSYLKTSRER